MKNIQQRKAVISPFNTQLIQPTSKYVSKETKYGANNRVKNDVHRERQEYALSLQNNSLLKTPHIGI
jgi:hypothetical protein